MKNWFGIGELSERLARDRFENNFFTRYRGTPRRRTYPPLMMSIGDGDTASTRCSLQFSRCISPSAAYRHYFRRDFSTVPRLYLLDLSIFPKNKKLNREGDITGLLEVTLCSGKLPNGKNMPPEKPLVSRGM